MESVRKFRVLIGAFLVAVLAFTPLINAAPIAFAEGDTVAETQDVGAQEVNDAEAEPQADGSVTYGGEDLSDWTYTDNSDNSITLTAYNATATDIIIPGDFGDGKTVKINSFDILKDKGMTSLQVKASEAGIKVVYDGTNMTSAFEGNGTLKSVNLNGLDTSAVTVMRNLFKDCTNLIQENINELDTSSCEQFASMFEGCELLTNIDLSNLDVSKLGYTTYMFYNCSNLKTVSLGSDSNIWKPLNIAWMFYGCENLENLDLSHFDTSLCTNMSSLFRNLKLKYLDLSNFRINDSCDFSNTFNVATTITGTVLEEIPTAIIATDPKLKALEVDGKVGNGRIPYTASVSFYDDDIATQANDGSSSQEFSAGKIFFDSVDEFKEATKITLTDITKVKENPTKQGYTFKGWYTDASTTTPFTEYQMTGNDNVVLYAGWTAIEPYPGPETGDVDNPSSDINGDLDSITDQVADEASVSTATPVTGDNVAVVAGIALATLILALSTVVFARKRRQQ